MPLITFGSPKGGVGKTTLAAHVAGILARRGHRVLAIDLDPQNALRLHFGFSLRESGGFACDLAGTGWRGAARETAWGVRLLPFGAVEGSRQLELAAQLLHQPDLLAGPVREMLAGPETVVIADTAPGASAHLAAVAPLADLAITVLLADAGSGAMLPQVAGAAHAPNRGTLADFGRNGRLLDRSGVVLNQVDLDQPLDVAVMDAATHLLGARLIGAVCRDPALAEALAERRLLVEGQDGAGEDLALLADAISERLGLVTPSISVASNGPYPALREWGLSAFGALERRG